jgi:hypothetical protein
VINFNIFYLDEDIKKCAEYHCDKHIIKMITEGAQILSSVYYYTDNIPEKAYKLTHKNHPCNTWVRQSLSNWLWLKNFTLELYKEYQYRYGNKQHKAGEIVKQLPVPNITDKGITERPQAIPEQYKCSDTVKAYRNYYNGDKKHLFKWTKREVPGWVTQ